MIMSVGLLEACSGPVGVPVQDRAVPHHSTSSRVPITPRTPAASPSTGTYTVRPGDTLYSISWRYGLDYRRLAVVNGIDGAYTIKVGQRLILSDRITPTPPPVRVSSNSGSLTTASAAPARGEPVKSRVVPDSTGPMVWLWPAEGLVIRRFSESGEVHKGIDINGAPGDPVRSVADGTVVYAGNGLVGYGNLLIIKHAQDYLSAYAHNQYLLVREGQGVAAGQQVAELGASGTDTPKLHFEIRKEGKPLDPLKMLPKRL